MKNADRLLYRSRVWTALRKGHSIEVSDLPRIIGVLGINVESLGFVRWWIERGIVAYSNKSKTRIVLDLDLGPRPPSWRGDHDPNKAGVEIDPTQRLWNVLRISRSGYCRDVQMLAEVSLSFRWSCFKAWGRSGLIRLTRVKPSGRGAVQLVRDLGAIAPVSLEGRLYDPNSDSFIITADDGEGARCG